MRGISAIMLGGALALLASCGSGAGQGEDCDRECLGGLLDSYLAAMVAHDVEAAPLATTFRQTENAVAIPLGDGLWRNAAALGAVDRRYFDPVSGNAAWFGTLELPGGELSISSLRLHVRGGEVDEAEWHVTRASDSGIVAGDPAVFDVENFIADAPPQWDIPEEERLTRDELLAVTNSYFDGITSANAALIQAHPGCRRLENGLLVTGPREQADGTVVESDCMSGQGQFDVALVAGRRYPVVDVEQQAVLAIATFIRTPDAAKRRNHFMEYFYLRGGRIEDVYTAFLYPEPTLPVPHWPPYDGNFPLPESFGAGQ